MKIGIFDSGIGGLTVLKALLERLPNLDYVYLADTANVPYGERTSAEIMALTRRAVEWFFDNQRVEYVVLACNTASVYQQALPESYQHRVISIIEPTVGALPGLSYTGHIGLLATTRTVESGCYTRSLAMSHPSLKLHAQVASQWVPMIESDQGDERLIANTVEQMLAQSELIDTVVLGCTHFPIIEPVIRKFLPASVTLVNQGAIVAEYISHEIAAFPSANVTGSLHFFTTGDVYAFSRRVTTLLTKKSINILPARLKNCLN